MQMYKLVMEKLKQQKCFHISKNILLVFIQILKALTTFQKLESFLVNMDHITDVEEEFLLRNGERVPIRVRGRKDVLDAYNHYFRIKSSGN